MRSRGHTASKFKAMSAASSSAVSSSAASSSAASSSSAGAKRKRAEVKPAADRDAVLKKIGKLRNQLQKAPEGAAMMADLPLATRAKYENTREVCDMERMDVLRSIEAVAMAAVAQILSGGSFALDVPNRSRGNQLYVSELDRLVLKDQTSKRSFLSVAQVRKTAITARVMQLLHEVITRKIHITKRDLFYTDVKLFKEQTETDAVLDDAACISGCTRHSLGVVASAKGLVVGRVSFDDDGDPIDCTRMGVGGKAIPPFMDLIGNIRSDAEFILLIEKDAAFMRLAEDRFYNRYPCIMITGKGQPDVATRMFLRLLATTLKIPVIGLVDSDPYGLKILSVYMSGSKNMSYDSANLTTPGIKWLGVRPSDLDRYKIPEQCRLKMTDSDIATGKQMLEEEFIQKNPQWMAELKLMLKTKEKAEIQALSNFGFQYLTEVFLPEKIKKGDWI